MDHRLEVVNSCSRYHACLGDLKSQERSGSLSVPNMLDH